MVCAAGLLSGCATTKMTDSYCDVANPYYFDSTNTVDWLLENDRALLTELAAHNDTYERLCKPEVP